MSDPMGLKTDERSVADRGHAHDFGQACGHDHDHDHPQLSAKPDQSALISARRLTVTRQGRDLLQSVDLDLWPGEIVTLIGPNGAGKTTLVKALLGLERVDHGRVFKQPNLVTGYMPQKFPLESALPLSVERFLGLGLGDKTLKENVSATLSEVGAKHVLHSQLHQISGGELQRVLLARALLRRPHMLILDEPAQGVDLTGEVELYDLISSLSDRYQLSVLLVSHDLHTVMARSNRVICLNRHVCCSGVPDTVSKHPEYERLFGSAAAKSIAIYRHEHDHHHDLSGSPAPGPGDVSGPSPKPDTQDKA